MDAQDGRVGRPPYRDAAATPPLPLDVAYALESIFLGGGFPFGGRTRCGNAEKGKEYGSVWYEEDRWCFGAERGTRGGEAFFFWCFRCGISWGVVPPPFSYAAVSPP